MQPRLPVVGRHDSSILDVLRPVCGLTVVRTPMMSSPDPMNPWLAQVMGIQCVAPYVEIAIRDPSPSSPHPDVRGLPRIARVVHKLGNARISRQ
jgi:hypothetical protein